MKIKFSAPMVPVTFKRPDSNDKRRFDPKEYAEFKTELGWLAKIAVDIFSPFKPSSLRFGDADNHLRSNAK